MSCARHTCCVPRHISLLALAPALLAVANCASGLDDDALDHLFGDEEHEHTEDVIDGKNAGGILQGLARPGRWQLPADVAAIGDQQQVRFDNAPPWDGGTNCSGGPTAGARALRTALLASFPQIGSIGIYNCRVIAGTNSMSLHGVGRALDVMIPTSGGAADNDLGDPIAHWLIRHAQEIGVQTIIWDRSIWRVSRSPRFGEYTGSNPHVDHLHVEINIAAGRMETPWFQAPPPPPEPPFAGCPPLPAAGGIVEEDGPCFALHGPAQYWRAETAAGHGGSLLWTNAFQSGSPSNHAEWRLSVSQSGPHRVEIYLDPAHAQFASTRYALATGSGTVPLVVNQGAASGWRDLGTFELVGGADVRLAVYDNVSTPVGTERRIAVDAVRVTAVPADQSGAQDEPAPVQPSPEEPEAPEAPAPQEQEEPPAGAPDPSPGAEEGDELHAFDDAVLDDADPGTTTEPRRVLFAPTASGGCSAAPASPLALALLLFALSRRAPPTRRR
jgi:hypothetical protein